MCLKIGELETVRSVPVVNKAGGDYIYLGMADFLRKNINNLTDNICLKVNIDGIPIYKSKKWSLWPICIMSGSIGPMAIALWYGKGHPSDVQVYLQDFIDEMQVLLADGLTVDGHHYVINLDFFVCDAPARAFLKGIIQYNGYNSCERCTIHGERVSNQMVFSTREVVNPRSDEAFQNGEFMVGKHPHQLTN